MGSYDDEAPRLSEIGRMINSLDRNFTDFRQEFRAALLDKVNKEQYVAERDALKERVIALENRAKQTMNTIYGGLATIVVGIVTTYLSTRG